jgi:hypothetical protein
MLDSLAKLAAAVKRAHTSGNGAELSKKFL